MSTKYDSSRLFDLCCITVYALYIQDRRIAYGMMALLVAEVGSLPGIIYKTVPNDVGVLCMNPIDAQNITFFASVFSTS